MSRYVALRLRKLPIVHWYLEPVLALEPRQIVLVRSQIGREVASVLQMLPEGKEKAEANEPFIKEIIRIIDSQDEATLQTLQEGEKHAFATANEKIKEHKLPMKLLKAEYLFDQSRLIFYYKAETKVDFRELLKSMSTLFKTRIELRQIGVRDETKLLGGIGCCGKMVCCRQFISKFCPVSTKMAKDQNMSLNPLKLSGICGRLLCCLSFEQNYYAEFHGKFPKIGSEIVIGSEKARVTDINYILQKIFVGFIDRRKAQFPFSFVHVRKEPGSGRNLWWLQGPGEPEPDLSLLAQPTKSREPAPETDSSGSQSSKANQSFSGHKARSRAEEKNHSEVTNSSKPGHSKKVIGENQAGSSLPNNSLASQESLDTEEDNDTIHKGEILNKDESQKPNDSCSQKDSSKNSP